VPRDVAPLGHVSDVMSVCATLLYAIIMVRSGISSSYSSGSGFAVAWFNSLSSEHICIFMMLYIF